MNASLKILMVFLVFLLSSCAATLPPSSLQLSGMHMNLERPAKNITAMAISKDGSLLVTINKAKDIGNTAGPGLTTLRIWDLVHGRQLRTVAIHDLHVASVALSPDGKYALLGGRPSGNQSSLGLWELESGEQLRTFPDLKKELSCVAFSPDGKFFLATHGTYVFLFNTDNGDFIKQFDVGSQASIFALPKSLIAAFTPDGDYIVTGGSDAILKMWDIESGLKVQHFAGHEKSLKGGISGIAISSDSQFILTSAAGDSSARKWDIATGQQLRKLSGLDGIWHGVWGTALSPDNKHGFVSSRPLALWDLATGKPSTPLHLDESASAKSGQEKTVTALYHPNGKSLFLNAGDMVIRLIDTTTGRDKAMLVGFDDNEWIIITAEGYYNASGKGADYLTANLDGKSFPVERFYDTFFRPDIVMAALAGDDTRNIAPLTMSLAAKAPPPQVGFATIPSDTDAAKIKVCYQASSTGGGIGEMRMFHNGKLIVSDGYYRDMVKSPSEKIQLMAMDGAAIHEQMRSIAISEFSQLIPVSSHEKGESFTDCKEIDTVPGENEIALTAFNKGNTVQSPVQTIHFRSNRAPTPPHLYILSIGANKYKEKAVNLKYAAKDATDIQLKLGHQAATVYSPAAIHQEVLVNEKANKSNIQKKINELSSVIKPEDGFILFIAGHSILLQNQSYVLTSDYDGILSDTNTLSSNEIVDISKKIKSLHQLFIFDSCQAGGIDTIVSSLFEARMFVLAKKMGLPLFTSISSVQEALDGYKGNGLFTHVLLDGLSNKQEADSNNDRTISVSELGNYTKLTSTALSKKLGYQQTPLIINNGKDIPLYKIQ
ncbi:MAG: caspase family protein [Proteobacteria bacterium]|nr:caspase family protein [Pseudomonadota bacterium]